jgi:hypothetical protein
MICQCCGEVKNDWGNKRYCRECYEDLRNSQKEDHREDYRNPEEGLEDGRDD